MSNMNILFWSLALMCVGCVTDPTTGNAGSAFTDIESKDTDNLVSEETVIEIQSIYSTDQRDLIEVESCWPKYPTLPLPRNDSTSSEDCSVRYPERKTMLVTNTLNMPKTREQGRGVPSCGNPNAFTTADAVIYGLGKAIDRALKEYTGGAPIISTIFSEPRAKGWVKSRLGINNGKAACASICIAYKSGKLREFGVKVRTIGKGGWSEARNHGPSQYSNVPYSMLGGITKSVSGGKSVLCANVKHWDHDDRKQFQFMIRTAN